MPPQKDHDLKIMKRKSSTLAVLAFSALMAASSHAVVVLTGPTIYTQDFDTLPSTGTSVWSDNTTIPGVYAQRTGIGTNIDASNGFSGTGSLYSFGDAGSGGPPSTERALGSIGSGGASAGSFAWGFVFQNNTSDPLTLAGLRYKGEQWRDGGPAGNPPQASVAQSLTFSYQVANAAITNLTPASDTGWTLLSALDFTSPSFGGVAGPLPGNTTGGFIANAPGIVVPAGQFITVRWRDINHTGNDHALAIDDVTIAFIPEPSSALLGALGMLGLLHRRRLC